MVQTRSQGSTTSVPKPRIIKQRKRRKNSRSSNSDSSSDEDERVAPVSLPSVKNLETIAEENEIDSSSSSDVTTELHDMRLKSSPSCLQIPQPDAVGTSVKSLSPILEESESEHVSSVQKINVKDQNEPEEASTSESVVREEAQKKHRFYFPPARTLVPKRAITTSIDAGMEIDDIYVDVKGTQKGNNKINELYSIPTLNSKDSQLKDSIITPDFETKHNVAVQKSLNLQRKERRKAREADAGKQWFNFKPPEMTDEIKRDLDILKMRSILDPKRFYKNNDRKALPRYFQIGRIVDDPTDFYSSRVPKKQRKQNLTEELLADAEFKQYQKRKYNEIQMKSKARGAKRRRVKHQKFSKHNRVNTAEGVR